MLPPILCVSNMEWDAPTPTNRQQLMRRFARHTQVAVVEAPLPLLGSFVGRSRRRLRHRGWRRDGDVRVLQAWDWVPYPLAQRSQAISRGADVYLRHTVRTSWRQLGWPAPVLWLYPSDSGDLLGLIQERLAVYHCIDDYDAIERYNAYRRVARYDERKHEHYLVRAAAAVITTSAPLYDRWRAVNSHTYLMPNVADTVLFRQALDAGPLHPALGALPEPRVAYVGALDQLKVDFDLIKEVARQCPDVQFVCVGPVGSGDYTAESALPRLPNIHYLGRLPQHELPTILRGCAAGIIPYHLNAYTASVSPLKLYEYLAAGCPVVSTALPALAVDAPRGVTLCDSDPLAFARDLRLAAGIGVAERVRIADAAMVHSWDRRVEELIAVIERHAAEPLNIAGPDPMDAASVPGR